MLCHHCLEILNVCHGPQHFCVSLGLTTCCTGPVPTAQSQAHWDFPGLSEPPLPQKRFVAGWMEWRITEQLLAFKLPHFWDLLDASVYALLPCHNTKGTEKWEQGPLRALLVALKLHYSAFIFLSCMNSKSSSKIQLWGSFHLNFSQIWFSVRTQQKNDDGEIHKIVPQKWNKSALKMGKIKSRWKK